VDNIEWLQMWYQENCDGSWEHQYGVEIGTLDNPGWYVKIDLSDTKYGCIESCELKMESSNEDWINCSISNAIFKGFGDSSKLNEIMAQSLFLWEAGFLT